MDEPLLDIAARTIREGRIRPAGVNLADLDQAEADLERAVVDHLLGRT